MKRKKGLVTISVLVAIVVLGTVVFFVSRPKDIDIPSLLQTESSDEWSLESDTFFYGNYLAAHNKEGAANYQKTNAVSAVSSPQNEYKNNVLDMDKATVLRQDSKAEFTVEVPEDGYYNIRVTYACDNGTLPTPECQLKIDGELPFDEAFFITFERYYVEQENLKTDKRGDQIRGEQIEVHEFRSKVLMDSQGLYREPFKFFLTAGTHVLTFEGKESDLYFSEVALTAPQVLQDYASYIEEYKDKTVIETQQQLQCEFPALKNDSSVRSEWTSDPLSTPRAVTNIKYNVFGGESWYGDSQSVSWKFKVEQDGLYSFAFRYAVPKSGGVSYRRISIDGEVPFEELMEYPFTETSWSLNQLIDKNGDKIYLYLEAGEHTITMDTTVGPVRQAVHYLDLSQQKIDVLYRQINMVTATVKDSNGNAIIDKNRDYELDKKIPTLASDMEEIVSLLEQAKAEILNVSQGRRQEILSTLEFALETFATMQKDPEAIPYQLNQFSDMVVSLSNGVSSVQNEPLFLDYMLIGDSLEKQERITSNILDNTVAICQSFIHSFESDYGSDAEEPKEIKIWASRGRDWILLLDQITSENFTEQTGISVDFNILPLSSDYMIITARSGGRSPDIALGMGGTTPVEFAAREAVVNLKQFDGFDELIAKMVPNAVKGYTYKDGVYALPETADFMCIFYRTDIFESLNLEPPETFDDVYKMMPILQENGMQFYYPPGVGGYIPFLFQYGEDYYSDDLRTTTVNNNQSIKAFDEFTNLFNKYKLPLQADFFQRMRMGEMPVGVAGYDMYVRLMTSAPELSGKWAMAPMVGHLQDGKINRSAPVTQTAAIVLKTENDPELSWEFLKWWMSTETQVKYGTELRNLLGVGSIWNSANMEAFAQSGLKTEHLSVIQEQWKYANQLPIVPGSYFVERCLLTAWTRNVINGESARIVLEDAALDINKELNRKYQQFN